MVNDSCYPIPQVYKKNKQYTTCDVNRAYFKGQFHHITFQPLNLILLTVDNNILQNIPIIWIYVVMAEDIYGTILPPLQGKKIRHKFQHVENVMVPNFPKGILDTYNKASLWCDIMHINGIGLLNTISWHIMFATGIMIKNRRLNNIEDGITPVTWFHNHPYICW